MLVLVFKVANDPTYFTFILFSPYTYYLNPNTASITLLKIEYYWLSVTYKKFTLPANIQTILFLNQHFK